MTKPPPNLSVNSTSTLHVTTGTAQEDVSDDARAVEHLVYEVDMMRWTAHAIATGEFSYGLVRNAVIESFAIHARILVDFLFTDSTNSDDVIAQHYCAAAPSWRSIVGEVPEDLYPLKRRVAKEIVHLSYSRLTVAEEAKGWEIERVAAALNSALITFADNAPKLPTEVSKRLRQ